MGGIRMALGGRMACRSALSSAQPTLNVGTAIGQRPFAGLGRSSRLRVGVAPYVVHGFGRGSFLLVAVVDRYLLAAVGLQVQLSRACIVSQRCFCSCSLCGGSNGEQWSEM